MARSRALLLRLLMAAVIVTVLTAAASLRPAVMAGEPLRPVDHGGGEFALPHVPHLSADERAAIQATLDANIERLTAEGVLPAVRASTVVKLQSPLAPSPGFADPNFFAVTNFVDHNPAYPNQERDYACGGRTYDTTSGYNHKGTDYYLWPFAWNKMDAGAVQVVAAADGVIIHRADGNPDRSCGFNGNPWNAVYIRHADGSIAWYGHLKQWSVTNKAIGAPVAAGEYLGLVGSSGNSTGPHLHLELQTAAFNLIDPYAGACNLLNADSWWQQQPEYYQPAVNKLTTGSTAVQFQSCPNPEVPNESIQFQPGNRIYFTAYYRDQRMELPSTYRLRRPDGSLYYEWEHAIAVPHYSVSYWYWAFDFPTNVPTGTWTFEVILNGVTTQHFFAIGTPTTPSPTATATASATPTTTATATTTASPTPSATPETILPPSTQSVLPFVIGP